MCGTIYYRNTKARTTKETNFTRSVEKTDYVIRELYVENLEILEEV